MDMSTQIKICGITSVQEAEYLNEVKVDYAGFVFFEKSKRNVTIEHALPIMNVLNHSIQKVAVTVNPDLKLVKQIEAAGFSKLQIHGDVTEEILEQTRLPIWKSFNLKDLTSADEQLNQLHAMEDKIAGYLLDAPSYGSGQTFSWETFLENQKAEELLAKLKKKTFILAGGLNALNVTKGITIFQPDIVDVSSGVEGQKGKEQTKINEFVRKVREHG
jgi:phosphoribosylanthranilate isomerase